MTQSRRNPDFTPSSPRGAPPDRSGQTQDRTPNRIAILGNHPPRQCGIATFTSDLGEALSDGIQGLDCFVLAMNDPGKRHAYPGKVRFEIAEADLESYRRAADFLNLNRVDLVSVQHEYGIFGGGCGSHVVSLLRELRMPIVTTLHTILAEPDLRQRAVMDLVAGLSERLVVMSALGARLLHDVHGVSAARIDVIPHGIPHLDPDRFGKERIGVEGRRVILTFGLLSPDKGIEHVIDALPAILDSYPDAVYIVLGATHPHVKDRQGEAYRLMLESRARRLGVDSSVIFHDRFVSKEELAQFLSAADIYITPYLKVEQITSGTLAYAVGLGKAVISTPYWYARELLAEGRGTLVAWRDAGAIAKATLDLFGDDEKRMGMCARAAAYGEDMSWPSVAHSYMQAFELACRTHADRSRTSFRAKTLANGTVGLPELSLRHLRLMTDDTGVLQHASFSVPRYEDGYCVDDNARALIVMVHAAEAGTEDRLLVQELERRYLAFVRYAWNPATGRFRNFMTFDRRWREESGSEDSHGRALWALGTLVGRSPDQGRQRLGGDLFHSALPVVTGFSSPRAWAFALIGIEEYLRAFQGDRRALATRSVLAELLFGLLQRTCEPGWPWFEDRLTYCNARLTHGLLVAGSGMEREDILVAGLRSLDWLVSNETSTDDYFAPIGSNGFFVRGGARTRYDQQPVEAAGMISACLEAWRLTGDPAWSRHARRAFDWYLGQNDLQQSLYDPGTGGCRDGLHEDRISENQGAESTLSFMLSLLEMRAAYRTLGTIDNGTTALSGSGSRVPPAPPPTDRVALGGEATL